MYMQEILLEIKLQDIVKNWNNLYTAYKKIENLPVKEQIKAMLPLLPGGVENEQGQLLQISEALPKLKELLKQNKIRLDKTSQHLLQLLSYISTSMGAAKEAGYADVKQAFGIA